MTKIEKQPTPNSQGLMECKYDQASNDIFLYLTKEGLIKLRKGDENRNFTLSTIHSKTKARFDLINNVSNLNGDVLEVRDIRPVSYPYEWYRISLSDKGYEQLKDGSTSANVEQATVMTRYEGGFKICVTVDPETIDLIKK